MNLSDSVTFNAGQQSVWNLLMDTDAIARAMPGVDRLIPIDGETNAWRATAKLKVAGAGGAYSGTIRMKDIQPITRYTLVIAGEGLQTAINGTALLTLSPAPDADKTIVAWDADVQVSGKLAALGERMMAPAASLLTRQFFQALARQLPSQSSA